MPTILLLKRSTNLPLGSKVKKTGPNIELVKALVQRFKGPTGLIRGLAEYNKIYIFNYLYT